MIEALMSGKLFGALLALDDGEAVAGRDLPPDLVMQLQRCPGFAKVRQ